MTIVMILGYPASGKTTQVAQWTKKGFVRLNRDTLGGSVDSVHNELERMLDEGEEDFVLDNTYPTRESRERVLALGEEYDIPVVAVHMQTSIEDAQVNACTRMIQKYGKLLMPEEIKAIKGDPNCFPPAVLFKYRNAAKGQAPTEEEGFDEIIKVPFKRRKRRGFVNKAIIVDYDGTLRDVKGGGKWPRHPDEVYILPNTREKLTQMQQDGYLILGISNQSDVGAGGMSAEDTIACFERTNQLLGIDIDYRFCPHKVPPIACYCRKPMPGLGVALIEEYKLDAAQCIYVGDRTSDKTFAKRSGFQFEWADAFFERK